MSKARDLANSAAAFSAVSATELGYVDGVTSAIQTQLDAKAASSTAVTLTGTQTLTNKTLTSPVISSITNTGTITLPSSTDTLVGRATTDTLTNKTLTSPALTTPTISTLTTAGDIVYGTGSGVLSRLGIGTAGQVLTVNSGATAPQWSTAAGGGKVLQVVSASYSTATATTSTSLVDSGITATITPSSASSKILIHYSFQLMRQNSTDVDSASYFQLVRSSTNIGGELTVENYNQGTNNQLIYPLSYNYYDSPSTTSATTYKIQFRSNSSSITSTMQVSSRPSQIILMEIGA